MLQERREEAGRSHFVGFPEKACVCFMYVCVCTFVSWCVWQWGYLDVSDYDAGVKSKGSGASCLSPKPSPVTYSSVTLSKFHSLSELLLRTSC